MEPLEPPPRPRSATGSFYNYYLKMLGSMHVALMITNLDFMLIISELFDDIKCHGNLPYYAYMAATTNL